MYDAPSANNNPPGIDAAFRSGLTFSHPLPLFCSAASDLDGHPRPTRPVHACATALHLAAGMRSDLPWHKQGHTLEALHLLRLLQRDLRLVPAGQSGCAISTVGRVCGLICPGTLHTMRPAGSAEARRKRFEHHREFDT